MLSPFSRFLFNTEYSDENGLHYLDSPEPFVYVDESDTRYHIVREGDIWPGLAYLYFPNYPRGCGLWWILCDFQPEQVVDPTIGLVPGSTVLIPSERVVSTMIFNPERRTEH